MIHRISGCAGALGRDTRLQGFGCVPTPHGSDCRALTHYTVFVPDSCCTFAYQLRTLQCYLCTVATQCSPHITLHASTLQYMLACIYRLQSKIGTAIVITLDVGTTWLSCMHTCNRLLESVGQLSPLQFQGSRTNAPLHLTI